MKLVRSPVGWCASAALAVHLAVAANYGWFRDELYFVALGRRLGLGAVDVPPLTPFVARLSRTLFGDSLVAIHVFPALAHVALILLAAAIARELGGGRRAQALAALGATVTGFYVATGSLLGPDVFDQMWWGLALFLVIRILNSTPNPRQWLRLGAVFGIGVLTKLTIGFLGAALLVGMLATPEGRQRLRSGWPVAGALAAAALAAPYLVWQVQNDFTTIDFWRDYGDKLEAIGPLGFVSQQVLSMNPVVAVLWIPGLVALARRPAWRHLRAVPIAFGLLFVGFMVTNTKFYFLAPMYLPLVAGGAVVMDERLTRRSARGWRVTAALAASGVAVATLGLPVLPTSVWARFPKGAFSSGEDLEPAQLPQHLADRFGWDSLTDGVLAAADRLPPERRDGLCVLASNYGEASALAWLGRDRGMPPVISRHNQYWLWGPGQCDGENLLAVGFDFPREPTDLSLYWSRVQPVARVSCDFCMPHEDDLVIYELHNPRRPLPEIWPDLKRFI